MLPYPQKHAVRTEKMEEVVVVDTPDVTMLDTEPETDGYQSEAYDPNADYGDEPSLYPSVYDPVSKCRPDWSPLPPAAATAEQVAEAVSEANGDEDDFVITSLSRCLGDMRTPDPRRLKFVAVGHVNGAAATRILTAHDMMDPCDRRRCRKEHCVTQALHEFWATRHGAAKLFNVFQPCRKVPNLKCGQYVVLEDGTTIYACAAAPNLDTVGKIARAAVLPPHQADSLWQNRKYVQASRPAEELTLNKPATFDDYYGYRMNVTAFTRLVLAQNAAALPMITATTVLAPGTQITLPTLSDPF